MNNKLTNEQKLYKKKTKKPNFIYNVLGFVWKTLFTKKYGLKTYFSDNFKREKGPCIFISNRLL